MVPPTIQQKLASLRSRERLIALVWGLACWLAIVIVLLLICGLIDWLIDRRRDTPFSVRFGLFFVQAVIAAAAGFWFLVWPQLRGLPDDLLALWVEDKIPHFQHRLISVVQFYKPGARIAGMSVELIQVVTGEADRLAGKHDFNEVADHARLKWSAYVLAPVLVLALIPFLIWPGVCFALLGRQVMLPIEIPHSIYLENISPEYWPIGDKIPIRYRVRGEFTPAMVGDLYVTPLGQPTDNYPLAFIQQDGKEAIFGADVHPSSNDLQYTAHMGDGRTKLPSEMKLVPRPVVTESLAWTVLPRYCGKTKQEYEQQGPDAPRYEEQQGRGDVVGIPGSSVRVRITVQKPVKEAWIELLGPEKLNPQPTEESAPPVEISKGKTKMAISADGLSAEVKFDLVPGLTGFRMHVADEHGFTNEPAPRRSLSLVPEERPQVGLLRDTFGSGADFDVEGLPVILGERVRIPYTCSGRYGLGKAYLLYRVLKKHESGNDPVEEEGWIRLGLTEIPADRDSGAFDLKTGVFANSSFDQEVPFHAVGSFNPAKILGRTLGGGRVFLKTDGLVNGQGKKIDLKSGDLIEFCVEIHAAYRQPESETPMARSETRVTTVLNRNEFDAWFTQVTREDERVRKLKQSQEDVFRPR